jgi:eukaryotic-like serine/threonine-protein kinase
MANRFELVNAVAEEALDLAPSELPAFLAARYEFDRELLTSVERLLSIAESNEGFLAEPAAGAEIRPGDLLGGRFRIIEELGTGGMSAVYRAEDLQLGEVALKVLHPEICGTPGAIERLRAEIRAARAVRHPNICPVFDLHSFQHEARGPITAFTMQYLPGETLAARLTYGPLDTDDILRTACGIASGIDAVHAAGILHCDLKPGNIILAPADRGPIPVIVDFGLAVLNGAGPAPWIAGSPQYMAPEQFRCQRLSAAADVYAFGLILYEMIAGTRPFPDEDLIAAAIRRNVESAPSLASVVSRAPHAWVEAIRCALLRDPSERPHSAAAVIQRMTRLAPSMDASGRHLRDRSCRHSVRRIRRRERIVADDARLRSV